MAQQVQHTETSTMIKATKVADYIVERIAAEGISHCFGVAGDYVFPICDAVDSSPKVKWIGCANELNASYAADGYARIRGAAMLATTYGVGELSALNGVMGAKAERSLVFHVVGMPSYQHQRVGKITHHTLGDGVFGNFVDLSGSAACCLIGPITNMTNTIDRIVDNATIYISSTTLSVSSLLFLGRSLVRLPRTRRRARCANKKYLKMT